MNFIKAYEIYSGGNEAPEIYHRWAGLSVLSSLASRRIWCSQGDDTVMSNLYVIFVGPAGNGKSTAMKKCRNLLRDFSPEFTPIPPKNQTFQSVIQDLGDDQQPYKKSFNYDGNEVIFSHASIICNEFSTLLKTDPLGWITFLTDIYDDDHYEYKIKNPPQGGNKLDFIPNPYLTLLGCMTPETTHQNIQDGIISGGFSRRAIFVYAMRSEKAVPRRKTTIEQKEAKDWCVKWARMVVHRVGGFKWEKEAEEFFDDWYIKNKKIVQMTASNFMCGWLNSKDQIVIKVAMMLELADNLDLVLKAESIKTALELVNATEEHFHKIFAAAGRNPIAAISSKIQALLDQKKEPILEKLLFKELHPHGSTAEIQEAINHLASINELSAFDYQNQNGYQVRVVGKPQVIQDFVAARSGKNRS